LHLAAVAAAHGDLMQVEQADQQADQLTLLLLDKVFQGKEMPAVEDQTVRLIQPVVVVVLPLQADQIFLDQATGVLEVLV
jgi:hypothetical protein